MKRITPTLIIAATLLSSSCSTKTGLEPTRSHFVGIDVSHHQGSIEWKSVGETKGLEYVYIKASEGVTYTDPEYSKNIKGAKEARLLVGAYHFYSEKSDITKQFEHFKKLYPKGAGDLIPMLDVEPRGKVNTERMKKIRRDVKTFQDLCRKYYDAEPMLYIEPLLAEDGWLASLIGDDTKLCIGHPYSNPPKLNNGRKYTIWQYTYSGKINGIAGGVDMHRLNGNTSIEDIMLK